MSIDELPTISETLKEHSIQAKKSFGQNFLFNLNITDKIVSKIKNLNERHVLEVGAGPGALSRSILKSAPKHFTVIEKDERFIPILQTLREQTETRMDILLDDALEFDYNKIETPVTIIANLPYNVATPLLLLWLKEADRIEDMALMFQKEVGDRIVAQPHSKSYGRLSVISQFICTTHILFDLPPNVFTPPPKVISSVVHLKPRAYLDNRLALLPYLEKVTEQAFGQRRKMIRQSLKSFQFDLEALGLDETLRAEHVLVDDFVMLAKELKSKN